MFPHHENEIAQSECTTGEPFVNYWMHAEFLLVDGRKMSKSLGNFYTLRQLVTDGYRPDAIRWMLMTTHYRQKLNFSVERLDDAIKAIERLRGFQARLEEWKSGTIGEADLGARAIMQFTEAMDQDLNISGGLAAVFELVREGNRLLDNGEMSHQMAGGVLEALNQINSVLGILDMSVENAVGLVDETTIQDLIEARKNARQALDFARADALRAQLENLGIELIDTPAGTRWKRRNS